MVGSEARAILDQLNVATSALGARVEAAIERHKDDLSNEATAEFLAIAEKLNSIAADPENPIP